MTTGVQLRRLAGWLALAGGALLGGVPAAAGEMVLSQFLFRDLNRNGVYELGETPVAGVPVALRRGEGAPAIVLSNLAGFANFVMSPQVGQIPGPGEIEVEVLPPEGLRLTGAGGPHRTTIRALDGAPAGLVAAETPPFVGLAPALSLSIGALDGDEVACIDEDGLEWQAEPAPDGRLCPVSPGLWTVRWSSAQGVLERRVEVAQWPLRLPRPVPGLPPAGAAETREVIGFDDLITSVNIVEVPAGVGGLSWQNAVAAHRMYYQGAGYINGTVSGEYAIYNSSGHVARMFSDTPFDFVSAKITLAWPGGAGAPVMLEAFRDGRLVARDAFHGSDISPVAVMADWTGITELRLWHGQYWQVVVDDIVAGPGAR